MNEAKKTAPEKELSSLFHLIEDISEKLNSVENTANEACISSKKLMPHVYNFEEPKPGKNAEMEERTVLNGLSFIYQKVNTLHNTVDQLRYHLEQVTAF